MCKKISWHTIKPSEIYIGPILSKWKKIFRYIRNEFGKLSIFCANFFLPLWLNRNWDATFYAPKNPSEVRPVSKWKIFPRSSCDGWRRTDFKSTFMKKCSTYFESNLQEERRSPSRRVHRAPHPGPRRGARRCRIYIQKMEHEGISPSRKIIQCEKSI